MMKLKMAILAVVIAAPAIAANNETVQTKAGDVTVERLATLEFPWGMTYLPDGRLLITEKPGRMRIFDNGRLSEPITGLPKITYKDQGGLHDVEIDPDFARNNLVYFYFVEASDKPSNVKSDTRDERLGDGQDLTDVTLKGGAVARARLDGTTLRDVKVIWRQEPKTMGRGHFGGRLAFAPDGTLFITSGDRQRFDPAQDMTGNVGKVVRINADGSIPKDNPFVGQRGKRPDVWSLGHRNPLGAAINPESKQLWIVEMGPMGGDELNIPQAGKNYGWPVVSNGDNYNGAPIPDHPTRPEFEAPMTYWQPVISPSGFIFYAGTLFPDWQGSALIGGLSSESLIRLTLDGDKVKSEERIAMHKRIRDVIEAPDGAVLLLTDAKDGELLQLKPAPGASRASKPGE